MTTFRYLITAEDAGDQIQHFLRFKQGISRKVVISLKHLPEGILLNGAHARTIDLLREGDTLEINLPDQARKLPPCEIDVPRLYWDRDVAVFNKPAGMPVHQSGGHIFGTLASVYATLCEKEGSSGTFRAVNRIDKDTTGAVVVARHQIAAGKLWKAVTKRYVAVVSGVPQPPEGLIDLPLEREIPLEMKRVVSPDGERAVTEYKVLATAPDESCALVGFILRQALHCAGVAFTHPITGEQLCLTAPLPEDMAALLEKKGIDWRPVLTPFVEELLTVQPTTVEEITERYRKPKQKGRP